MELGTEYSLERLELSPYRNLQQTAKSLHLPSNVKKVYLVQLIHTRVFGTQNEVESILERIKQERLQKATAKAKAKVKRCLRQKHIQTAEISSTCDTQQALSSPQISVTPRRCHVSLRDSSWLSNTLVQYNSKSTGTNLPIYREYTPGCGRVLRNRSYPICSKYNNRPVKNSVISLISQSLMEERSQCKLPGDQRHRSNGIPLQRKLKSVLKQTLDWQVPGPHRETRVVAKASQTVSLRARCLMKHKPAILGSPQRPARANKTGRNEAPALTSTVVLSPEVTPCKRQRSLSGIYPIHKETPRVTYTVVHNDRDGAKMNQLVQKPIDMTVKQKLYTNPSWDMPPYLTNIIVGFSDTPITEKKNNNAVISVYSQERDKNQAKYENSPKENNRVISVYSHEREKNQAMYQNVTKGFQNVYREYQTVPKVRETVTREYQNELNVYENIPRKNINLPLPYENLQREYQNSPNVYEITPRENQNVTKLYENVPRPYNNVPNVYENIPKENQYVQKVYENIPSDYQNVPKLYENLTTQYHNNQKLYDTVPRKYQNVSNLYESATRDYQNAPMQNQNIPRQQREENLPRIHEVFSGFNNVGVQELQPIYTSSDSFDRLSSVPTVQEEMTPSLLETVYNFRRQFVTHTPLVPVHTTCNTQCVFSTPVMASAMPYETPQTSTPVPIASVDPQRDGYINSLYEYIRMCDEDLAVQRQLRWGAGDAPAEHLSPQPSESADGASIPDMVEDALDIITRDGDYMARIDSEARALCPLCAWAGPAAPLEHHVRSEHASSIVRASPAARLAWSLQQLRAPGGAGAVLACCRGGCGGGLGGGLSGGCGWGCGALCVLRAVAERDTLGVAVRSLSPDAPLCVTLTVYSRVTGEPFTWSGRAPPLDAHDDGDAQLRVELSKLDLIPNSAQLQLVNREFVTRSQSKVVCGSPDLSNIFVIVNVTV